MIEFGISSREYFIRRPMNMISRAANLGGRQGCVRAFGESDNSGLSLVPDAFYVGRTGGDE